MDNDLISRAALQKSMEAVVFKNVPVEHQRYMQVVCDVFAHLVTDAPAADAVPVVRCKDCIYSKRHNDNEVNCTYHEMYMRNADYCSCGIPKMDGDNHD